MSTVTFETTRPRAVVDSPGSAHVQTLSLYCPACRECAGALRPNEMSNALTCSACGFVMKRERGIWRALAPSREGKFQQFIREYQTVRLKEGRGVGGVHYFLSLPYKDITGRNSWQWKIRGRSFRYLERTILPRLQKDYPQGMDILDVGAGNCWMSYRLARRDHRPVAVDIIDNDRDGLSAARHYLSFLRRRFPRFLAEMDRVPFTSAQFDLVAFNASFHYSENYDQTLQEALRCLRRPGHVLIVDSPFYSNEANGLAMVKEKHAQFQKRFGFNSDSIASREFLTRDTMEDLGKKHGIRWAFHKPWYGLAWAFRPMRARILGRREPAKFLMAWGIVNQP